VAAAVKGVWGKYRRSHLRFSKKIRHRAEKIYFLKIKKFCKGLPVPNEDWFY